ncbi:MAG TPA: amino acid ABC transporter substrate-binding protein [Rhizomicrobium sp.]|nr:amino acid ABC transporter substrate-binding protein [Rhizomicrobium sp.]
MKIRAILLGLAALFALAAPAGANTLDTVRKNGFIRCGVSEGQPGFSNPDARGNWTGIDVDYCRAVAVAIFNDPNKVRFVPVSFAERFTALQAGQFDILSHNTTWTMDRDVAQGLEFIGTIFYDGQGFMVRKSLGINSALKLNGATLCTQTGTTSELNAADFFRAHNLKYKILVYQKESEYIAAYDAGRCDAATTDRSGLAGDRLKLKNPADHILLPDTISKEPLGPAIRQGDQQWGDLCRWTLFALVNAEELGVSSKTVDAQLNSTSPEVRRLLGKEGGFGAELGLTNDWAYRIIKRLGNYGEIYERGVGLSTPLKLPRGLNALWNKGGIMYAPPIR